MLIPLAEIERLEDDERVRVMQAIGHGHEEIADLGRDSGMTPEELRLLDEGRPGRLPFDEGHRAADTGAMTAQRAYSSYPLAPWAEIVPNMPPMTVDDLHAIPDDGWAYELIEGVLVRMLMSGFDASNVGLLVGSRLSVYVEDNDLGAVTGEQGGYRLDPAHPRDTELGPDYAFVRADRLPPRSSPEYSKALHLAPDLAIEVASENQFAPGLAAKARTYLAFGTRLVWVIWPRYRRVDVCHPGDDTPTALGVEDALDGEDVVPGFSYPVGRLFR